MILTSLDFAKYHVRMSSIYVYIYIYIYLHTYICGPEWTTGAQKHYNVLVDFDLFR